MTVRPLRGDVHARGRRECRLAGQSGQSSAMVLSMLMFLVLFAGVVVDVGQAVNRRVALQIVADAGAFTGATTMAVGANSLARWNKDIPRFWEALRIATADFTVVPCPVADLALDVYRRGEGALARFYNATNQGFATLPYQEARRVSRSNILDLFPGELGAFEAQGDGFVESDAAADVEIPRSRAVDVLWPTLQTIRRVTFSCLNPTSPLPEVRSVDLPYVYEKLDPTVQYFVWRVKAPATQALMFDGLFGPDAIPEMKAVAVAKPTGGSVGAFDSSYLAKIVPVDLVMRSNGTISDPLYFLRTRIVTH